MKVVATASVIAFMFISVEVSAASLDSFMAANKKINDNVEARMILKEEVSMMIFTESRNEGRFGQDSIKRRGQLLQENGSDYAVIAVKRLKNHCIGNGDLDISREPDSDTCKFFLSIK